MTINAAAPPAAEATSVVLMLATASTFGAAGGGDRDELETVGVADKEELTRVDAL